MVPRIVVPYKENKVGEIPWLRQTLCSVLTKVAAHFTLSTVIVYHFHISYKMKCYWIQGYWAWVQKGTVSNMFVHTVLFSPILWPQCSLLHHIYSSNQVQRKFPLWSHERDSLPPFWDFLWAWPRASSNYIHLLVQWWPFTLLLAISSLSCSSVVGISVYFFGNIFFTSCTWPKNSCSFLTQYISIFNFYK